MNELGGGYIRKPAIGSYDSKIHNLGFLHIECSGGKNDIVTLVSDPPTGYELIAHGDRGK